MKLSENKNESSLGKQLTGVTLYLAFMGPSIPNAEKKNSQSQYLLQMPSTGVL